jgi:ergothioneine biosynthesis protein EgtB
VSTYCAVRALTEALAAPLSAEDQTVQSMPDASPTKWHLAHTSWFFETFLLGAEEPFDPAYRFLFNSYYEAAGPRHSRAERGLITRPGVREVLDYRAAVDQRMTALLDRGEGDPALLEIGLHHEQQHQELIVMDALHLLSRNPLLPAYGPLPQGFGSFGPAPAAEWIEHPGGIVECGHDGHGFAYDNEGPRHEQLLRPFLIGSQLVTNADWLAFVADGGYLRPELWMSEGWATVQAERWEAPEYWHRRDGEWWVFGLDGLQPIDVDAAVLHISWFEAAAFAQWKDARLPLEAEWEAAAPSPRACRVRGEGDWYGVGWQWTASQYAPYPGFRPAASAVGEYNGKFMVNQHVLRGSCVATPPGHARRTYRNFYPARSRWAFSTVRLARDAEPAR